MKGSCRLTMPQPTAGPKPGGAREIGLPYRAMRATHVRRATRQALSHHALVPAPCFEWLYQARKARSKRSIRTHNKRLYEFASCSSTFARYGEAHARECGSRENPGARQASAPSCAATKPATIGIRVRADAARVSSVYTTLSAAINHHATRGGAASAIGENRRAAS